VENEMKEFHGEIGKAEMKKPIWDSNATLAAILDSLSAHVVTLDRQGRVDYVSRSWLDFAHENGGDWVGIGPGADYLGACSKHWRGLKRCWPDGSPESHWSILVTSRGDGTGGF
jgi:PAS domain-containing protein